MSRSGFDIDLVRGATWSFANEELISHSIRYWARWLVYIEDLNSSWAKSWLSLASKIPIAGRYDFEWWDSIVTMLLQSLYVSYWRNLWDQMSKDAKVDYWKGIWATFLKESNYMDRYDEWDVLELLLGHYEGEIPPFNKTFEVFEHLCDSTGIDWFGVEHPAWVMSAFSYSENAEAVYGWDIPITMLRRVSGHEDISPYVVPFIKGCYEIVEHHFQSHYKISTEKVDEFTFWFPLENQQMPVASEAVMGSNVKLRGITSDEADKLKAAGGIRPLPSMEAGDVMIVISQTNILLPRAYEEALRDLGRVQAMLRTSDPGFRWEVSYCYFWSVARTEEDKKFIHEDILFAERRDGYQVYGPLDPNRISLFQTKIAKLESLSTSLSNALLVQCDGKGCLVMRKVWKMNISVCGLHLND